MNARDVMTREVVSVSPDMSARQVAELLLAKGISAVPVVDDNGAPIGMVSEGDLIGRAEAEREARRDWWLTLLAEGETLNPDFLASLRTGGRSVREIMSAPVVTVGEETDVVEIARLLAAHRIKRVPVVRDGRIVGIVSRADLLHALAAGEPEPAAPHDAAWRSGLLARFNRRYHLGRPAAPDRRPATSRPAADEGKLMAADFRGLVEDFQHEASRRREETRRAAAEERRQKVVELIDHHISDQGWRAMLHEARQAAEHGQKEFMLLRFPSQLCSDGGRAINAPEPNWPATLRGEAAEIYLRWEHDLKPHGFHLAARVLDFPGGFPGDVGLFLTWGE
ncbi:MAG: CBS domain-containing protein [Pseudomonadota bacterium]